MARFRNTVSGVVMSIDDNAPMLPGSWEPYDEEPTGETKKTTARKRTSRKTEAPDATSDAPGPDDE